MAPAELTIGLVCVETAVMAEDLLCVVLVSVLVGGCLTSGSESLVMAELLPETTAGLISTAAAALTDDFTDAALTVVTAVVTPPVLV